MVKTKKKRVGILRGGSGFHYENSLTEGQELILYLLENLSNKWKVLDIFVDKNNVWHLGGVPIQPDDLTEKVDVIWNVSYPSFSKVLEILSIPVIGTGSFAFSLSKDRSMFLQNINVPNLEIPKHIIFPLYQKDFDGPKEKYILKKAKEVLEKFSPPWIIRSLTEDANMGVHIANTFPELVEAIEDGVNHQKSILIEELIAGKNTTTHSLSGFRGENIYAFPVGPEFSSLEKERLSTLAKNIHEHLSISHYLKSDFVITPRKKIYLKDLRFKPDLKKDSDFCRSCELVGAKTEDVIEHILNLLN